MKKWAERPDKGNYTAGPSLSCFAPEPKKKKKRQITTEVNTIGSLWQTPKWLSKGSKVASHSTSERIHVLFLKIYIHPDFTNLKMTTTLSNITKKKQCNLVPSPSNRYPSATGQCLNHFTYPSSKAWWRQMGFPMCNQAESHENQRAAFWVNMSSKAIVLSHRGDLWKCLL